MKCKKMHSLSPVPFVMMVYFMWRNCIIHRECFGICVGEHWPVGMLYNICDSLYLFVSMFASSSCLELVPLWTSNDTWCCMLAMTVTVNLWWLLTKVEGVALLMRFKQFFLWFCRLFVWIHNLIVSILRCIVTASIPDSVNIEVHCDCLYSW